MKKLACVAFAGIAGFAIIVACDGGSLIASCHDIPDGGCPQQGGVECQDPTCAAAYTCQADGGWSFAYACPAQDSGPPDVAPDTPVLDAGYDIDAPPGAFGGPGCTDLEPPDCPLGEALICSAGCCGCIDLFVCDDGGWDPWGACTDAGPTQM
jgi:hypothetical protein